MACFSTFFWSGKEESDTLTSSDNAPWFISGVEPRRISDPSQVISRQIRASGSSRSGCDDPFSDLKFLSWNKLFEVDPGITSCNAFSDSMSVSQATENVNDSGNVRDLSSDDVVDDSSTREKQVALDVLDENGYGSLDLAKSIEKEDPSSKGTDNRCKRHRKTGVFEIVNSSTNDNEIDESLGLSEKNENKTGFNHNKLLVPPASSSSSAASATSEDESEKHEYLKNNHVRRCESSDSAIVHSDEEFTTVHSNWGEKNEEIDELPYSYPVFSPYSPRRSIDQENVPSRTILESQFVALPLDRKASDAFSEISDQFTYDSRRQSCVTDDGDEIAKYRYWRTPSVVVSDYSDDPMGITLEDIEYIRNKHRENSSSPDSSLHSSYSNLNLYGSNPDTYQKLSDCSTCSFSGDEDADYPSEAEEGQIKGPKRIICLYSCSLTDIGDTAGLPWEGFSLWLKLILITFPLHYSLLSLNIIVHTSLFLDIPS